MFNQQKNLGEFPQALLLSKLFVCAEEAGYSAMELPQIKTCIQTFVASLSDYDQVYVSGFCKHDFEDLIALIKEPSVLLFLIHHKLNLHWIFGSGLTLKDESEDVLNRIRNYNAPWGKLTTLTLARMLTDNSLAYFVNNDIIHFHDLRSWDKTHGKGIQFVYEVLALLSKKADRIQTLLENKTFDKASLHAYLLEHGTKGPLLHL